jgi:hypothetical protein
VTVGAAVFHGDVENGEPMRRLFLAAVLALTSAQAWGQKELIGGFWKCTGQNGNIRYTNIQSESVGCQLVADRWFPFSNHEKKYGISVKIVLSAQGHIGKYGECGIT